MVTLDTIFFTLVIMFMFLLILEQIYSMWSCQDRWQSIINPRYLTLTEWSRGWPAKTIRRWRLEFNFCLGWKIFYSYIPRFSYQILLCEKAFRILLRPIREAKRISHTWKNRFASLIAALTRSISDTLATRVKISYARASMK